MSQVHWTINFLLLLAADFIVFFYQFSLSGRQMIFSLPPLPISDFQKRLSLNKTRKLAESQTIHRGRNSKQINIPKYISKFFIYGAKMLDKCVKSQKKFFVHCPFLQSPANTVVWNGSLLIFCFLNFYVLGLSLGHIKIPF